MANCNRQQLNITCGTDVVLHDTLIFDGDTFDPALSTGISANLVSSLGKRTALEVEVADGGLIIYVPWEDRNAGYYGLEVTGTCNSKKWATYADSLIHYTRATEMGAAEVTIESDYYDITQVVGFRYSESPIKKVTATIDDEEGTPEVDADYDGKNLSFEFHNMKGNRGNGIASSSEVLSPDDGGTNIHTFTDDDGNEHTFHTKNGRKGTQGDSFQPIEDVSGLVLAHTTGQDNTKAMSQKGVTDTVEDAKDAMGEMVEITQWNAISKAQFVDGNVISAASSSSTQACWWSKVSAGDKITITATNSSSGGFRVAFTNVMPAVGVTVQGRTSIGGTSVNATIVSPISGYVVLNHASDAFTDRVVKIRRKGDYTELQEKAPLKTLMDVVDMAGYGLSDVESTNVYSKSLSSNGNLITKASDSYRVWEFPVQEEKLYQIHGRIVSSGYYVGYVFYDAQWMSLSHGEEPNGSARTFDTVVISPKGAAYLRVSGTTSINGKLAALVSSGTGQKTIFPKMSYDFLSNVNGFFSTTMTYNRCVSTIRFIKVSGGFTVTLPEARLLKLVEYDENFQYLRRTVFDEIEANVETSLGIGNGTRYIKIQLASTVTDEPINVVRMKLKGDFPDNWDTFNISQYGCNLEDFIQCRQLVIARVHVTDPKCCEDDTSDVQDTGEYFADCGLITRARWEIYGSYLWDFGRIFLPATYDNLGEPIRLIIYCHGAAVNYVGDGSVSAAEKNDLDPTYWLAEGYAVLDVEGNPFDNENEHQYSPPSMDCYVAAYKWAIEHYNLKRDGVFLGGRSMGGSNAINLMRKQCPIPVIAACPNVPSSQARGLGSAVRKDFWAKCCGLDVPDGYVWGNGVYTDSDKAVLFANFDKVVKSTPIFGMVTDMPITEEFKRQFIDCYYSGDNNGREALWSSMHAMAPCPVKLFACYEDATAPPARGAMVYYNMFKNCGQIVELRLFHDSRYIGTTDERAHHYDTEDPAQRQDGIVTRYGTVVDDVPTVYIEMLKFWRRFEQE